MALTVDYRDYLRLLPKIKQAPQSNIWLSYDAEADVLYINVQEAHQAVDSDMTDDDVIVRYGEDGEVTGFTILRASQR